MSEDPKTVPKPNEVRRDQDDVHYHDVDETNVGATEDPPKPPEPDDGDE
jgi:hypothetical protein